MPRNLDIYRGNGSAAHLTTHSLPHHDFRVMVNEEELIDGVSIEAKISEMKNFDQVCGFSQ